MLQELRLKITFDFSQEHHVHYLACPSPTAQAAIIEILLLYQENDARYLYRAKNRVVKITLTLLKTAGLCMFCWEVQFDEEDIAANEGDEELVIPGVTCDGVATDCCLVWPTLMLVLFSV